MSARLVTAVALYGPKASDLQAFLNNVQRILNVRLGDNFCPYSIEQMHSTIVRLNGATNPLDDSIVNRRYLEVTGLAHAMNIALALDILATHLTPPVSICIGGYERESPATFSSRGEHPYERMFSVQKDALVLIGWPLRTVINGLSCRPLDRLRREMSKANIWHYYHESPEDIDNDFHIVVGNQNGASQANVAAAVGAVRAYIGQHPIQVDLGVEQVSIIAADTPTLARAEFVGRLPSDPADIARLYH